MGLGKTVQVACFLQGLQLGGMLGPSLLVSPASLVTQWAAELKKWAPAVRFYVWHESGRSRSVAGWSADRVVREARTRWDPLGEGRTEGALGPRIPLRGSVIITTYSGLRAAEASFGDSRWDYMVLDEGHRIRNPAAAITACVKRVQARHKLLVTGSPLQNSLQELWSLVDFAVPDRLGDLGSFEAHYAQPIAQGAVTNASASTAATAF